MATHHTCDACTRKTDYTVRGRKVAVRESHGEWTLDYENVDLCRDCFDERFVDDFNNLILSKLEQTLRTVSLKNYVLNKLREKRMQDANLHP